MNRRGVIVRFLCGRRAENRNLKSDGLRLFSYGLLVGWWDGELVVSKVPFVDTRERAYHRLELEREAFRLGVKFEVLTPQEVAIQDRGV